MSLLRSPSRLCLSPKTFDWNNPLANKIQIPVSALTKAGYTVQIPYQTVWGDLDVNKHVNSVVYFRYMENVRIFWMERVGMRVNGRGIGPIMGSIDCKFYKPLSFPDELALGCKCSMLDPKTGKLTLTHAIYSQEHDAIVAIGSGHCVTYDYEKWARVMEMPEEWVKNIVELDGEKIVKTHN